MKNFIIAILSFVVIVIAACQCQPKSNNNYSKNEEKQDFNYNINYNIPNYEDKDYNYDFSKSVYITRTGDCYHIGNCSHAKKSAGYMSQSQARKKGYRPCSYCCY